MLWFLLGAVVLFFLIGGARAFERASVTSIKSLFAWIAALGGLSLALLLLLTGKGGVALGALAMFGPLLYQKWQASKGPKIGRGPPPRTGTAMTRDEAYEVLGLHAG